LAGAGGASRPRPIAPKLAGWGIAVVAVIVAVGLGIFLSERSSPPVSPSAPPAAAAPLSEARQLVAKARPLWEPWDVASPGDFQLAQQLLKKAVELDPSDGEAYAAYATMMLGYINNYDRSSDGQALARSLADKAIKLAPESPAARVAYAYALRLTAETWDEAERRLREEVTRQPTNKLVLRTLGSMLMGARNQPAQALVYFDRAAVLPGGDPVAHYLRSRCFQQMDRIPEAQVAVDEALALAPSYVKAHAFKLALLLAYESLERAKAHLAKVPPAYLTDENGATMAALIWLYAREPGRCIEALRVAPDYPVTNAVAGFTGPKAYLSGLAQQSAGNRDAARTEWQTALRVVEQRLAGRPNTGELLVWKATLLAALGDRAAVAPLLADLLQRQATDGSVRPQAIARIHVLLGEPAAALDVLERSARERNSLRYEPVWDPLRDDPRFQVLAGTRRATK
jgi:tetratricopeptide (TPR) repeat protein